VRDVAGVERGGEAQRDDREEERERRERDPVTAQAARGEAPRALA
jgi:hypothetical protein